MSFKVSPAPSGRVTFAKDDVVILINERAHLTENGGRTWRELAVASGYVTYHNGVVYNYGSHGVIVIGKRLIHREPSMGLCVLTDGTLVSASYGDMVYFCEGETWRQNHVKDIRYRFSVPGLVQSLRNNGLICILHNKSYNGTTWLKSFVGPSCRISSSAMIECPNGDIVIGGWNYAARVSGGVVHWCSMGDSPLNCFHLRGDTLYGTWRTQFLLKPDEDWYSTGEVIVPLNSAYHLTVSAHCLWFGQNCIVDDAHVLAWTNSGCIVACMQGLRSVYLDWSIPNHRLLHETKQHRIRNILLAFRRLALHFVLFLHVMSY
jgi:hypothetical protein